MLCKQLRLSFLLLSAITITTVPFFYLKSPNVLYTHIYIGKRKDVWLIKLSTHNLIHDWLGSANRWLLWRTYLSAKKDFFLIQLLSSSFIPEKKTKIHSAMHLNINSNTKNLNKFSLNKFETKLVGELCSVFSYSDSVYVII